MGSCRATSFYLAPGVQRYFRDHTLVAVLPDGSWSEIKHRGDLARIHKEHPDWVGTVLCGSKGGAGKLRTELLDDPAKVQRWNVDERVVEGRRPEGPQFVLHRMSWNGVEAVGGPRQVIDAVLPGANKTLRKAAAALIEEHGDAAALRLSLACALRGITSDDELALLLLEPSFYELQPWLGVEIARYRENFLRATEHVPHRRGALIHNLLTGETLTDSEIVTAIGKADRINPVLAEKLLHNSRPSLLDIVVDIACLHGLSREQHLEILLGNKRFAKSNLAGNIELDAMTVEEAYLKGADLKDVIWRLPLTDAMFNTFLEEGSNTAALCSNTRLSSEQLHSALTKATGQLTNERGNALTNLAHNKSTSESLRIELIQLKLEDSERTDVLRGLAKNETNTMAVCQALLATNDQVVSKLLLHNGALDQETLSIASLSQDPTVQILAVTELLKRWDIGVEEELKILEKCEVTTWPLLATMARHSGTLERILEKAADVDVRSVEVEQAVFLVNFYAGIRDERGEVVGVGRVTSISPSSATPSVVVALQGPREESRDVRDVHVITTRRGAETLTRFHHPIEYAAEPAAVIRESIDEGESTREQFFSVNVSDVRRLPDWGVLPFRSVETAQTVIDGYQCSITSTELLDDGRHAVAQEREDGENAQVAEVISLEARVLDSRAAIEQNAEYMRNCTSGYVSSVARGEVQLVGLYDKDGVCQLNIELQRAEDGWTPGEINTRFNGYRHGYENTPQEAREIADRLAERLNSSQVSAH